MNESSIEFREILPFGYVRDMRVFLRPPGKLCTFRRIGDTYLEYGNPRKGFVLYDTLGNTDVFFPILQVWTTIKEGFGSEEEVFLEADSLGMIPLRVEGSWNY